MFSFILFLEQMVLHQELNIKKSFNANYYTTKAFYKQDKGRLISQTSFALRMLRLAQHDI